MNDPLRVVTWNVCDGFARKYGHLEPLHPGIAILQGVRPGCLAYADLTEHAVWTGAAGRKGFAAVGYDGWTVSRTPHLVSSPWFLPLQATKNGLAVNVVAVWVDSPQECAPPTIRALDELEEFIKSGPTVIAGDFNQTVSHDVRKGPSRRFADVLDAFGNYGMSSAWHQFHGEAHGQESQPTHFGRGSAASTVHIDFAFASPDLQVTGASLGSYEQYVAGKISDHVPLVVDFKLQPRND